MTYVVKQECCACIPGYFWMWETRDVSFFTSSSPFNQSWPFRFNSVTVSVKEKIFPKSSHSLKPLFKPRYTKICRVKTFQKDNTRRKRLHTELKCFFFVIIILNCPGTERALLRTNPRSLKRKTVRVTLIGSCGSGRCWLSNNGFVDETIQVFVISELDRTNQLVE